MIWRYAIKQGRKLYRNLFVIHFPPTVQARSNPRLNRHWLIVPLDFWQPRLKIWRRRMTSGSLPPSPPLHLKGQLFSRTMRSKQTSSTQAERAWTYENANSVCIDCLSKKRERCLWIMSLWWWKRRPLVDKLFAMFPYIYETSRAINHFQFNQIICDSQLISPPQTIKPSSPTAIICLVTIILLSSSLLSWLHVCYWFNTRSNEAILPPPPFFFVYPFFKFTFHFSAQFFPLFVFQEYPLYSLIEQRQSSFIFLFHHLPPIRIYFWFYLLSGDLNKGDNFYSFNQNWFSGVVSRHWISKVILKILSICYFSSVWINNQRF